MEPIVLENFQFERLIDNGKIGKVYLVIDKISKQKLAFKIYPPTWSPEHFENEVNCCRKLQNHANIVKFLGSDQTRLKEQGSFLLMEYCDGGNLRQILHDHRDRKVPIDATLRDRWIRELISGIAYIHLKDMVHRDIHPRNIMFLGDTLKVGGLRLIRGGSSVDGGTRLGVTRYSSPEVANMLGLPENKNDNNYHHPESDIWSYACVLYEMYTNKRVIEEKTEMAIYKKLSSSDFRIPELETDNNVLKKLFPSMMSITPDQRPSSEEIINLLADPQAL